MYTLHTLIQLQEQATRCKGRTTIRHSRLEMPKSYVQHQMVTTEQQPQTHEDVLTKTYNVLHNQEKMSQVAWPCNTMPSRP